MQDFPKIIIFLYLDKKPDECFKKLICCYKKIYTLNICVLFEFYFYP